MHQNDTIKNEAGSRRLIPVVRQPRKKWRIPRIDAQAQLLEQKREEEQIQALCQGTTPQGREILQKIIFRAERMMEDKSCSEGQIVAEIEGQLMTFELLRGEFLLLLSRFWRVDPEKLSKVSAKEIAVVMLLYLKLEREISRRRLGHET
ncbi:MAG TPA: hypothetical protein VN784_16200 [Candidatus Limnocylindrales bacterium]|nr:hypothetical protein [Candidatus Limnocylindrales bacterium]